MTEKYKTDEVKSLRLGGEYELKNVGVLNSTYEARNFFLRLIGIERPNVASNLLRIINFEYLPQPSDQITGSRYEQSIEKLFGFFILNLFKRDHYEFVLESLEIDPKIRHTPLLFYLDYLFKKQNELNLVKEQIKQESLRLYPNSPISDGDARKESIEKLMKWSILQNDVQAEDFCNSLKQWASTYNLTDDWCLDFALDVLKNFKLDVIEPNTYKNNYPNSYLPEDYIPSSFWHTSLSQAIWARTVQRDTWRNRDPFYRTHPDQPKFEFKWRGELIEGIWNPQSRPEYFREQMEIIFWRAVLLAIPSGETFVGQLQKFSKELSNLNDQIEKYVEKAKRFYEKLTKTAKEADQEFVMVKTPVKRKGDRDFRWLIDFQIPAAFRIDPLSSESIAKKCKIEGSEPIEQVERAVFRLMSYLGLTKRGEISSGRKKNIKESRPRNIPARR